MKPLIAAMLLALCVCGPVTAREPTGAQRTPDDTYIPPRTPAQAAFERMKLGLVAQINAFSLTTTAQPLAGNTATTNMLCSTDCGDGSGGSGDGSEPDPDEPVPGEGSTSGTTGFIVPDNRVVLAVRARHQSTAFWCGPASGQVVINYSRGYVYESLNGDSTATNWRTQATIASWMKTNQTTGTLGGNLAAALNRPDAVLRPVPDWTYVYARNTDGEDMHAKVVVDVDHFAMPLVIAVKPHKADAEYWLPSWPREASGAKHWIVIFGYDGLWDGTTDPTLYYTESAGNGSKNPGVYTVSSMAMWKVNQYNASTIVW
ncbi:MAG TPA: hypothetical protein VIF08_02765 [Candidatus Limnocylindrales bacterium]